VVRLGLTNSETNDTICLGIDARESVVSRGLPMEEAFRRGGRIRERRCNGKIKAAERRLRNMLRPIRTNLGG
jgi:hypothetical protein